MTLSKLHPVILHTFFYITMLLCVALATSSCTFPTRTGYDRKIGGYKPVASKTSPAKEKASAQAENASTKSAAPNAPAPIAAPPQKNTPPVAAQTTAGATKAAASKKIASPPPPRSKGSLEKFASQWLGAKYEYGAAGKTRTDCSGFVMQVFNGYYNISLDHNAATMYKDARGTKISRGNLKEGDLVFFGSFWKIDHVGIFLAGDRFIHASTSRGVMISPMNDKYWSPKYQGARRFK